MDYKCGGGGNEGVDRISELPDDVLVGILSLLPLESAAATSVLSTRWLDLWRHTPNLNIILLMNKTDVNSILESHKCHHLKEVKIYFPLSKSDHCLVTKWLEFVFSRRVEVLELDFTDDYDDENYVVLEDVLRGISISKSTNLKSLYLNALKVSGKAIELLLLSCPSLKRLIIEIAHFKKVIEVRSSMLKHLEIGNCSGSKSVKIKIYAPNLTCLRIDGIDDGLCMRNCYTIDAPKLVSAYVGHIYKAKQEHELIRSICSDKLKTLKCSLSCPKGLLEKGLFPQMPKLRELIVTYRGSSIQPITSLLFAVPYLEVFEIKYIKMNWIKSQVVENVERFCHHHLKEFKFTCFNVDDCGHMDLMSYILDNCVELQKIFVQVTYTDEAARRLAQTEQPSFLESYEAISKYAKQLLQSKVPTHIELIVN